MDNESDFVEVFEDTKKLISKHLNKDADYLSVALGLYYGLHKLCESFDLDVADVIKATQYGIEEVEKEDVHKRRKGFAVIKGGKDNPGGSQNEV